MNDKWTIIVLGATGDLAKRQLIPALYQLVQQQELLFIGAAHEQVASDNLIELARPFMHHIQEPILKQLKKYSSYIAINFDYLDDFKRLAAFVKAEEKQHNFPGKRLIYLATPADYFCIITQHLYESGLVQRGTEQRIVYEKPFGHDRASASALDTCIGKLFDQEQLYRIDHYLTKELVNNIILLRFANILFKPVWNHIYIDHIEIIATESISIEGRGSFYDVFGVLRDVIQNHLLQLIALVAMDEPTSVTSAAIRKKKIEILQHIKPIKGILGQYEGYLHEQGVAQGSTTETFAALQCLIELPQWNGVPFYIKAGKSLDKKLTEIRVIFKNLSSCIFSKKNSCDPNILTIRISPEGGFLLQLNAKKPHNFTEFMPVVLDFCYSCLFATETPRAYEVLLREVMVGDQSVAVSAEEINYQWLFVDTIKSLHLPLYFYKKGSEGPAEVKQFFNGKFV